jgi:hypothetical protein
VTPVHPQGGQRDDPDAADPTATTCNASAIDSAAYPCSDWAPTVVTGPGANGARRIGRIGRIGRAVGPRAVGPGMSDLFRWVVRPWSAS